MKDMFPDEYNGFAKFGPKPPPPGLMWNFNQLSNYAGGIHTFNQRKINMLRVAQ